MIFTIGGPLGTGDQAAVLNQDGTVNTQSNPAVKGTVISIYGTGAGVTSPQATDGSITPSVNPPMPVAAAAVTIGGQTAQILYAGAAPGLVAGVLQVNAVIPAAANSGAAAIVLSIGGVSSQNGTQIWLK